MRRLTIGIRLEKPCLFGNLHWLPRSPRLTYLVMFNTVAKVFQWFRAPTMLGHAASLLEMEGTLAISNSHMGGSEGGLWLLQDYKSVVWVQKYRIKLPVLEVHCFDEMEKI
jgi:hypothetical protein